MGIKAAFIFLACTLISACGGSDESTSSGISISSDVRLGLQNEPFLIESEINDNDSLTLNTRYSGRIGAGDSQVFRFISNETLSDLMVKLTFNSGELELFVSSAADDLVNFGTGGVAGDLRIVTFDALSGNQYQIEVESESSQVVDFELVFTRSNRETLKMLDDEYFLRLEIDKSITCENITEEYKQLKYTVINWKKGYVRFFGWQPKLKFSEVSGNTIKIFSSGVDTGDNFSYSYENVWVLTVNPSTGHISGSQEGSKIEVENGVSNACSYETSIEGKILL